MRSLWFLLFCMAASTAFAAGPTGTLGEGQTLRGRFVQERHLQGFAAPLKTEGRFLLAPGKGLIWKAETPFAVTTVVTAAGIVQEVKGTETMRLPSARVPFLAKLYAMLGGALSGDWSGMEGDFDIVRSGQPSDWQVTLKPRSGGNPIPFAGIAAKGRTFVEQVRITKPDGDFDELTFLDQTVVNMPPGPDEAVVLEAPGR